jgi:anthranilate synthase component 2
MPILVIDNYDSFTYNLVHLIGKCTEESVIVQKNDEVDSDSVPQFRKLLLSPGPGLPSEAGAMPEILRRHHSSISILGICLGWQAIAECFDTPLINLPDVCHGIATPVQLIKEDWLFRDCPPRFQVGRYHSWAVDAEHLSPELEITALDDQRTVMAGRHRHLDIRGLQFHPESILSEYGETIIRNWLNH